MPTAGPNQRLKRERQLKGWSQAHLASQIEVPDYYISRWERGEVMPSPYYQQRLCTLFGKTALDLGFLSQEETETPPREDPPDPLSLELPPAEPVSSPPVRPPLWKRRILLLLVVVLGLGGAGGLFGVWLLQMSVSPATGTLSFASSAIGSTTSSQGVADEIQIQMTLDRPPTTGMAYYAWLTPDQNNPEGNVVSLGTLTLHGTSGTLSYRDSARNNLLLAHGGLLVTEQPISPLPQFPSTQDERYQAIIPQTPSSGSPPYTLLDHLRHLLASDLALKSNGIPGGLVIWLLRNTKQIATWAMDAQTAWQQNQTDSFHQDLLDIADYLDGLNMVQQDPNLSSGQPVIATNLDADQQLGGKLGLLNVLDSQPTVSEGYLPHIQSHLRGLLASPGGTDQQQAIASQLLGLTSTLTDTLTAARQDLYTLLQEGSQTTQLLAQLRSLTTAAFENSMWGAQEIAARMQTLLRFAIKKQSF